METRDFCYWLQGFFELDSQDGLTKEQVQKIRKKLDSCFEHEVKRPPKLDIPMPAHRPVDPNRRVKC